MKVIARIFQANYGELSRPRARDHALLTRIYRLTQAKSQESRLKHLSLISSKMYNARNDIKSSSPW